MNLSQQPGKQEIVSLITCTKKKKKEKKSLKQISRTLYQRERQKAIVITDTKNTKLLNYGLEWPGFCAMPIPIKYK